MLIRSPYAMCAAVFCTVLLGTALMTLVFMSSDTGHDDAAATHYKEKE